VPRTPKKPARRTGPSSALQQLRDTITVDALRCEVEDLLIAAGREADEYKRWKPVLAQVRISKADTQARGASESPERQLRNIARYCAEFEFCPEELCFEAQSGHLTDKRPRRLFEEYRLRIEDGSLDVAAVLTYNIDRFTRDRYIGERWLSTLKHRGIDLHVVDEMEPPLPLLRREEEYARAFLGAWRESVRTSKRVRDVQVALVRENRLLSSVDSYGHRPVWEDSGGRRRQVAGVVVEAEAEVLREAHRRIGAGEPLYSIVTDFNERGLRGRQGGKWTHNSLGRILKSPRMVGMQRKSGEAVNAPIAPIIGVEDWERTCEALMVKVRGKRRVKYPMSGLGVCAACGSPVTAGGGHYRCSRAETRNTKKFCVTCEMPNGRCMCSGAPTAADGHVHAFRAVEPLDLFLVEAALAAYDTAWWAREAAESRARTTENAGRRADCDARLDALNEERRTLAKQARQGFVTEEEADEELRDIVARTNAVREELAQLRTRARGAFNVSPEKLREDARTGGVEFVQLLVSRIIDHYVLHPASKHRGRPYDGIELVFAEGFEQPASAVEALRADMNKKAERLYRLQTHPGQSSVEDENLALMLWQQNLTTTQIAQQFNAWKRPTARDGASGTWTSTDVLRVTQRACERNDVEYVTRTRSWVKYPEETRNLIYELCLEKRGWPDIVEDLKRLKVRPWDGGEWTPKRVRACYAAECARRSEKPRGRRPGLPEEMRRLIRLRKRVQGQTYTEIAQWLDDTKVRRPNHKKWDAKAVQYLVAREDARLAALNEDGEGMGAPTSDELAA
jgi:Recombinase/Resolvase, N terminal domain